jgi:hypothetical protein
LEFSKSTNKFYVCCYLIEEDQFQEIVWFRKVAEKILAAVRGDYLELLKMLKFNKYG